MAPEDFRIVFMGTPEFAVPTLAGLISSGFDVCGVVTAPDRPSGRGLKLKFSPVKEFALAHNLPVFQPEKLRDKSFVEQLRDFHPHLFVVVAFRMLPEAVWKIPVNGTINLHASLLPQYRGAAPINWAVINGEKETGLTTFFIDDKIDTGHIIDKVRIPLEESATAGDMHDLMMELGARLLVQTVSRIMDDDVFPEPQTTESSSMELKPAPKLRKEHLRIRWDEKLDYIYNRIRGLSPYPGAYTSLKAGSGEMLHMKIFSGSKEPSDLDLPAGSIRRDGKRILIACEDGWYIPEQVQLAGKQRMLIPVLLNGLNIDQHWSAL